MKRKLKIFFLLLVVNFAFASSVYAQGFLNGGNNNPAPGLFASFGNGTFKGILQKILELMLEISGVIAMFFLVLGGYYYMTAGQNEDQNKKGKKIISNAIIGLIIIIMSWVILVVVTNAINGDVGAP